MVEADFHESAFLIVVSVCSWKEPSAQDIASHSSDSSATLNPDNIIIDVARVRHIGIAISTCSCSTHGCVNRTSCCPLIAIGASALSRRLARLPRVL